MENEYQPPKQQTSMGIAALILGILSVPLALFLNIFSIPLPILSIVFGYLAKKENDIFGLVGIILGIIAIVIIIVVWLIFAIVYVYVSSMTGR